MSLDDTMPPKTIESISEWRVTTSILLIVYAVIGWSFWPTIDSLAVVWNNSETYTHGYIILPISLWLVWHKRHALAAHPPRPALSIIFLLVASLLVWAMARLTSVSVIEHLAFIGVVVSSTWLLLGHQVARVLAFPLFFLFLAVPMGQDLVPILMDFTADFTVKMLELTGIPVYRDGLYFEVPTGRWSVVEACSGIRYLIASVTLGLLYAYLVYRSIWRRIAFVVLSVAVPILANGFRAYIIVMIGHLSDMTLAVGVDHLIYGWVFFGIVMAILFWIGSFWSEAHSPGVERIPLPADTKAWSPVSMLVAAILVLSTSATIALSTESMTLEEKPLFNMVSLPVVVGGWTQIGQDVPDWQPHVSNAPLEFTRTYQHRATQALLYVAVFPKQSRSSEAVNSMNRIVDPSSKDWSSSRHHYSDAADREVSVNVANVEWRSPGQTPSGYRVWQWYRIGVHHTAHPYEAKLREVQNLLTAGRTDGAYLAIATSLGSDERLADAILGNFMRAMLPEISHAIDQVVLGPKSEESAGM